MVQEKAIKDYDLQRSEYYELKRTRVGEVIRKLNVPVVI